MITTNTEILFIQSKRQSLQIELLWCRLFALFCLLRNRFRFTLRPSLSLIHHENPHFTPSFCRFGSLLLVPLLLVFTNQRLDLAITLTPRNTLPPLPPHLQGVLRSCSSDLDCFPYQAGAEPSRCFRSLLRCEDKSFPAFGRGHLCHSQHRLREAVWPIHQKHAERRTMSR